VAPRSWATGNDLLLHPSVPDEIRIEPFAGAKGISPLALRRRSGTRILERRHFPPLWTNTYVRRMKMVNCAQFQHICGDTLPSRMGSSAWARRGEAPDTLAVRKQAHYQLRTFDAFPFDLPDVFLTVWVEELECYAVRPDDNA
jgi:hypothetical protein